MRLPIIIIAVLTVLGTAVKAQAPAEFSFKGNYKISTPAELSITTNDGFIFVNSTESAAVEVFFIVKKDNRVLDIGLEELKSHLEVSVTSTGNSLDITIHQRESDWTMNWRDRYSVSFQINAPRRTSCTLKTSDGDIRLKNFDGAQQCRTSDGNISAENLDGDLNAQTSDGNITLINVKGSCELVTSDGEIKAEHIHGRVNSKTSDGGIFLNDVEGDNAAKTSDGDIVFEAMKGSLNAQTSDGNIQGEISTLTNSLYLKTSDGDINVTLPAGIGLDLILKGEDINTRLENFSGDTGDHHVEGKIRGGGIAVELITSDGNINLNYN